MKKTVTEITCDSCGDKTVQDGDKLPENWVTIQITEPWQSHPREMHHTFAADLHQKCVKKWIEQKAGITLDP